MKPLDQGCLASTVAGIDFAKPLLNAASPFSPQAASEHFALAEGLGALVLKTTTLLPQAGNPLPNTWELPGIGMLNSIGLRNPGLQTVLDETLPTWAAYDLPAIVSLAAHSSAEFADMATRIAAHANANRISALELNLSCPNVDRGGLAFGCDPTAVRAAVAAVTQRVAMPVFAKLTPNVGDIVPLGAAALEGGAHGLVAINTVLGVAIDTAARAPVFARVVGGYSGPGIKPIALHAVWQLHHHFPEVPIIGVGGIDSAQDVLEFVMAGASLVQIGTAGLRTPDIWRIVARDLTRYCESEKLSRLSDLRGCAHTT